MTMQTCCSVALPLPPSLASSLSPFSAYQSTHASQTTTCLHAKHIPGNEIVLVACKQAADRFMHMLELHGGPEHLVVFITSDQDFCEKIQELQRRNFKVVVLYHGPSASQKPVSITSVADESHDWLTFLKQELRFSHLTLAPYDPTVYHGASQGQKSGITPTPPSATFRQPSQESKVPVKVGSLHSQPVLDVMRGHVVKTNCICG